MLMSYESAVWRWNPLRVQGTLLKRQQRLENVTQKLKGLTSILKEVYRVQNAVKQHGVLERNLLEKKHQLMRQTSLLSYFKK